MEVEKCTVKTCPLWPLRFGGKPHPSRGTYLIGEAMGQMSIAELSDARITTEAIKDL